MEVLNGLLYFLDAHPGRDICYFYLTWCPAGLGSLQPLEASDMTIDDQRAKFFDNVKARAADFGEPWEERAERLWTARLRAVRWFDQPLPPSCALCWEAGSEPEEFRMWDLYSLDDYDYVAAIPPDSYHYWCEDAGPFGCCRVDTIDLPNGWQLRIGYHS